MNLAPDAHARRSVRCTCVLLPAEHPFEFAKNEVDDLVIIWSEGCVFFDSGEGICNDGEEHAHQPNEDNEDVQEEEEDTQTGGIAHRIEVKAAQGEGKQRLHGLDEVAISAHGCAEDHVSHHAEGKEVDEEHDDEILQVLGGNADCVSQHSHPSVESEHLDELHSCQVDNECKQECEHLIPNTNCDKVDIFTCSRNKNLDVSHKEKKYYTLQILLT